MARKGRVSQGLNCSNRTMFTGDNLDVLRSLNEACVDLVYLDPPFNSNRNYSAPIGSKAAGASFRDVWTKSDVDVRWLGEIADKNAALYQVIRAASFAHGESMESYLCAMSIRLLELRRVLKDTGSIYLHVDPTASHYLKLVMDVVFGKGNFRNEIVWCYRKWANTANYFQKNHDTLLFYSLSDKYTFHKPFGELSENQEALMKRGYNGGTSGGKKIVRIYDETNPKVIKLMPKWEMEGRKVYYVKQPEGLAVPSYWNIPILSGGAKERCGYPTQKPLKLLERIISASSNEGDVVLDPFCGCATACVAAEKLGRRWLGIDISDKAVSLVKDRMRNELESLFKAEGGRFPRVNHVTRFAGEGNRALRVSRRRRAYNCAENKQELFGRQQGRCVVCGEGYEYRFFHVDHVVPRAKGGGDEIGNLQLLCSHCNGVKGVKDDAVAKGAGKAAIRERIARLSDALEALG